MTSGLELKKYFENKVDKSYSKFVDNTKLNRIFKMALSNLSEKKYMGLETQKEYDEMRYAIHTEMVFPISNNKISIAPLMISNITTTGFIVTITTLTEHNLDIGQVVNVSGVQGLSTTPNINGEITVYNIPSPTSFSYVATFIGGTYTPNTGLITHNRMIDDYLHLFTVKCKTRENIRGLQVSQCLNRTPVITIFNKHNNLATGEKIVIANHPNNDINGTFYYEAITTKKGRLWMDETRLLAVVAPDSSDAGGTVSREYYEYAEPLYSDRKISSFEVSTPTNPKVQTADAFLKFSPDTTEITIDYFSSNIAEVDVSNNTFDLELVFPFKLLMRLVDEAIMIYTSPSRDALLNNLTERGMTP